MQDSKLECQKGKNGIYKEREVGRREGRRKVLI